MRPDVSDHEEKTEALLAKIRQGPESERADALALYVQLVRPRLIAFIERQLGAGLRRKVEAEDILQEVSVEAVRALSETDLSERDPFPWLCQLVEWRVVDAHRHFGAKKRDVGREVQLFSGGSSSRPEGLIDMLVRTMTTPSQAFERNANESRLHRALSELTDEQREALRLRYVQGLPSKQIAEKMGKTDGAVRVMLARSVKRLQTIIDG